MMSLARLLTALGWIVLGVLNGPVQTAGQEPSAQGLHDLVVYDPGAHERGLPAPEFVPHADGLKVEIPPTVHVHRYYYSGDKEIQGPIIAGGQTVVVANHPKTGKRMYIDVVLPSGAPKIAYDKNSITYVYPNKRVSIVFSRMPWNCDEARIVNRNGQGVGRTVQNANQKVVAHVSDGITSSPLVQSGKEVTLETVDLLNGVKTSVGQAGAMGLDGIKTLSNMIPGVTYLKSLKEQQPQREYEDSIQNETRKRDRLETPFVETNR
jgi:hypothetical protein